MRVVSCSAPSLRPSLFPTLLLLAAVILVAGPAAAATAPDLVLYEGRAIDSNGAPLNGTHGLTLRYGDVEGAELLSEAFAAVQISAGRFELKLGQGSVIGQARYDSLASVFADHPELSFEVSIDGVTYEPRVGVLPAGHSLKSRLVAAGLRSDDDDDEHWKGYKSPSGVTSLQSGLIAPAGTVPQLPDTEDTIRRRPYSLPVVGPSLSVAVRDLPEAVRRPVLTDAREVNPPRHESLFDKEGNRYGTTAPKADDLLAGGPGSVNRTPSLNIQFAGIGNVTGVLPPDTEGTVGPNHYVHVVNSAFAVFNKSGTQLTATANTNTLWAGFGGPCQTDNSGDAIFAYDEAADRYVLTQFAVAGSHQSVCFAVSQTPDPTGSYYLYEVVTPRFPDYYKLGVWPDASNNAYFFGTNSGFQGQYDVFAVDRANMLTGATARPMQFFQNFVNLMMPADLDGYNGGTGAPPSGSPGIFYTFRDGGEPYFGSPPSDSIDVWEFDVDWNTPANSTFTLVNSLAPAPFNWTVCGFFVSNCIPQPGTAQGIDSASWWPMQRLVYRNSGSHETLVGSWTVDVLAAGNRAAPRWFELRDSGGGWSIYQEGTHSPDAIHRWMPSVAMDGSGNIALGYSRGDGSNFPSIYYTTRNAGDALGTMGAEEILFTGTGSQTHSAARWGDYSSMELDPADDCTFWFTTEYLATTSSANWLTRIGSFTVPGCGGPPVPDFTVSCAPSSFSIDQGNNDTSTCTVTEVNGFTDPVSLSCAGAPAGVTCGFAPTSGTPTYNSTLTISVAGGAATGNYNFNVEANDGTTTKTQGISLTVVPAGSNGPQIAVYDGGLGAPKCSIAGSSCDSTTLLDSRDNLSPSEPNQPNTLDVCNDGTAGNYHVDESNDRIVVSTLDGGNFTEGDTVEIAATVYAWSTGTSDHLDLYYAADANSPAWVLIGTIDNPGAGVQTETAQYTLPAGAMQAVRVNFRYNGSQSPCSSGTYDDHDDLVFTVEPDVQCTVDLDCDNGAFCDGAETCNTGTGQCEAGTAPACDNGLFCDGSETCNETTDSCDAGTPPACDDGLYCNGAESCNEGTDSCDAGTAPVCDDGAFCNGTESCNEGTDSCDAGSAPCDPGTETCNETTDICEPIGCTLDSQCDDGAFCNGAETCNVGTGACEPGTAPVCDDGLFCNGSESCNEGTDSCDAGTAPACDDGLFCNGAESCNEGTDSCDAGTAPVCDDGAFCNGTETCNEGTDSCDAGTAPCTGGQTCDEVGDICVGGASPVYWFSFRSNTAVPGVGTVRDEDIVSYDTGSGLWSMEFDGSDVGLGSFEISGMARLPGGDLLLSFTAAGTIGGISTDDSDILRFTGTLGTSTSGTFSMYFDGSDVGLTSNGEDVDSIALDTGGNLIISSTGGFSGSGASGSDEDLFLFSGSTGPATSGSFTKIFDGSDVGLGGNGSRDVDAAGLNASGNLLFSTVGSFSFWTDEDVVEFSGALVDPTSGTFSMDLDLSTLGIASGEDIGSMEIFE